MNKYLYCIIPCADERTFDVPAIGNGGGPVHTICHQELAVVVSGSPQTRYESTRQNMITHEKVLERVMREFTLLPVRFDTVTDSASPVMEIQKLLATKFEEFNGLLKDMEGKVELGLKAFWRDEKAIFQEIVDENLDIRRLRDSLSRQPPQATQHERMILGEMVKAALERKRHREAARLLEPLRPLASRVQENKVIIDRMLLNAAFLVEKRREPEFDTVIKDEEAAHNGRIVFKYIGPVPPYNFVNIVVNWEELKG